MNHITEWVAGIARTVCWTELHVFRRQIEREYSVTPAIRVKLDEGAALPVRAHDTDAGADLFAPFEFTVEPHGSYVLDTGVHVELPHGTAGFLKAKSGLNIKCCLLTDGLIDEGYTDSIWVRVYNHGDYPYTFEKGHKVTQLVVVPVLFPTFVESDEIKGGERGAAGLGSTGL